MKYCNLMDRYVDESYCKECIADMDDEQKLFNLDEVDECTFSMNVSFNFDYPMD